MREQLDVYNSRNLEALLETYSQDTEQFLPYAGPLAKGRDTIRTRMQERFSEPSVHAELLHRTCMANVVIDHEAVTRAFPNGLAAVVMLCIYEVHAGKIVKTAFAIGSARHLAKNAA